MPHGENLILVLDNNVPVRAIMKDIGEEVSIMNLDVILPEAAKRLQVPVAEAARTLPLFTQVFDSFFRFISAILTEHAGYPETRFWQLVAATILEYQQAHPELAEKFERDNLFVPEINPDALNRMQISNNRQLRNRANPFEVHSVGTLPNPVAAYKTQLRTEAALTA